MRENNPETAFINDTAARQRLFYLVGDVAVTWGHLEYEVEHHIEYLRGHGEPLPGLPGRWVPAGLILENSGKGFNQRMKYWCKLAEFALGYSKDAVAHAIQLRQNIMNIVCVRHALLHGSVFFSSSMFGMGEAEGLICSNTSRLPPKFGVPGSFGHRILREQDIMKHLEDLNSQYSDIRKMRGRLFRSVGPHPKLQWL
jgi:hypothetical protein